LGQPERPELVSAGIELGLIHLSAALVAAVAAAAISLVITGTVVYSLGEGWNVADGIYFAVCTLTTSSIADPHLTLTSEALKIITALYVLTGIGILVEVARQLGVGFVKLRQEQSDARHVRHRSEDPPVSGPMST